MIQEISNDDLTLQNIPSPQARWSRIQHFALTFDGYNFHGSFEKCAQIANAQRHDTLTNLRTCLFFEQRRWRHFEKEPDEKAIVYIRNILEMIRQKTAKKE